MLLVLVWAILVALTLGAVGREGMQTAQAEFERQGEALFVGLHDRLRSQEAALFSFASLLATVAPDDLAVPRPMAEALLRQYPDIQRLAVARKISHEDLPAFLARAGRGIAPGFRLTAFPGQGESGPVAVQERDAYYPLVFVHPADAARPGSLGLDIGSMPFLSKVLQDAEVKDRQFVGPVFPLPTGEGNAFLMLRAVPRQGGEGGAAAEAAFALLVVRVASLEPPAAGRDGRTGYAMRHLGFRETAYGETLFALPAEPASALAVSLLPRLTFVRDFSEIGQPFLLTLERQLVFADLFTPGLLGVLVLAVISLGLLLAHHRHRGRQLLRIRRQEEQIRHLALHDQLTGLPNRRLLEDRLQQAVDLGRRQGERVGVLFLDIDGFKQTNERFGHETGDAVLQEIGSRLRGCVRESDTVARFGGDEFVLVCGGLQHASDALAVAEKVRQAIGIPFHVADRIVALTPSIGVSIYPDGSEHPETLLTQADVAMYRAKGQGRNRIQMFRVEVASALN